MRSAGTPGVITVTAGSPRCHLSSVGLPGSPRALVITFSSCRCRYGRATTVLYEMWNLDPT